MCVCWLWVGVEWLFCYWIVFDGEEVVVVGVFDLGFECFFVCGC